MSRRSETTRLLRAVAAGRDGAAEELFGFVYEELHALAERMMRTERRDHTLQPTALIHEAYLRLVDEPGEQWQDRMHFTRVAVRAMRRVLVDHARAHGAEKRGGRRIKVTLDEGLFAVASEAEQLLLLDETLTRLADADDQLAQIVELRFFGGLGHDDIAKMLQVSTRTVDRGWRMARAWLLRSFGQEDADGQ